MIRYYNGNYGSSVGNQAGMESGAGRLAGSPGYMPSEKDIQDRLFRRGMETDKGRQIQENIRRIRESFPASLGGVKTAQAIPGAPGNFGGLDQVGMSDAGGGMIPMPGFGGGEMMPMPGFAPSDPAQQQKMREKAIQDQRMQERTAALTSPINYNRPTPLNIDVDAVPGALEKIGGSAVIQLDPSQKIRLGGAFLPGYQEQGVPIPQEYRVEAGYSTPSLGVNVNYRPRRQGSPLGGGMGGNIDFKMPF